MTERSLKERMRIPRQVPATQDGEARATAFTEVSLGLTAEQAMTEAERCIECRRAPCVEACPVGVRIHEFAPLVAAGDFVTPMFVGGPHAAMIGLFIHSQFAVRFNWPLGAAIAVLLLMANINIRLQFL